VREGLAGVLHEAVTAAQGDIEEVDGILDDGVNGEGKEALGTKGDTASAGLVAGEGGTIDDENAGARGRELTGGGAAGGAGAYNEGIETSHAAMVSPASVASSERTGPSGG
jgi:hypothetical protein